MPIELKIPTVGESITEVQIAEWLKAEGDPVQKDEAVAIVDSEKTTFELPAPENGTLAKILHAAGETVKVGAAVAQVEPGQRAAPEMKSTQPAEAKATPAQKQPAAEKAERELPKEDAVESAKKKPAEPAEAQPKPARSKPSPTAISRPGPAKPSRDQEEEVVPMTMLRRTIARRLVEAKQEMAMLTTFNDVDMSAVQSLRHDHQEAFQRRYGIKLGLMSFFVKAAIDGLKQFPQLNAEVRGDDIVYRNYFDIGVAIATERGLVVPVLRQAERFSFAEVEQAIANFAERAQHDELKPNDLTGGTFTITNGGVFGSLLSTPIINPPQSGIIGLHSIQDRPVVRDGTVVIRPMMYLALTYDHRLVDGREAVLFLRRVKDAVENPARMLIEI
jgi:2-oxoglutarate dehydrogenase E2 component (dihydrolipoamide succinyltransferase)